ncbi:MAG: hypothetical protein IKX45_00490 [Bacteroidales bacterium]|nr:hypothetical protein [Bacteroidales bacterium]
MKRFLVFALAAMVALVSCNKNDEPGDDVSLDGRWDAPRFEENPQDIAYSFVFNGNKLDLYVIAYGWHCSGTFTYANDEISYSINSIQQSLTGVEYDAELDFWSYTGGMGSLDPNTLKPSEGYQWYDLGMNRKDLLEEYKMNYSKFSFKLTSSTTADSNIMGPAEVFKFKKK